MLGEKRMHRRLFLGASAGLLLLPTLRRARAAEHTVEMLNKGPDGQRNWFEPAVLFVEPGDTIKFVSTDKGHNSQSLVVPDGGETWKGKLSQDVSVTLTAEGLYAYKCLPHFGLGMVALIAVGNPSVNIEAVEGERYPGLAKTVVADLLEQVKAHA
jgi:pseudoazurin